jgi:hypothetical protein
MSPGGEWLGLLFCQWHLGAAARAGALPAAACPVLILPRADRGRIFFCPALAAGAFFPPAIGAKRLLPAAFWGFQDSENLVKSASLRRSSPQPPL